MSKSHIKQCKEGNEHLLISSAIILAAHRSPSRAIHGTENPAHITGYPSVFKTEEAVSLRKEGHASDVHFDQCRYGLLDPAKPTTILTNSKCMQRTMTLRCCPEHQHTKYAAAKDPKTNQYASKKLQEYPSLMCQTMAQCYFADWLALARPGARSKITFATSYDVAQVRTPDLAGHWTRTDTGVKHVHLAAKS